MHRKTMLFIGILLTGMVLMSAPPCLAGPGARIAGMVVKTLGGKLLLGVVVIIFLPMILYVLVREKIAERRALKDLRYMTQFDARFDWQTIKDRILESFEHIHKAWQKEDLSEAGEYMTPWYWQNQQIVCLNQWKRDRLYNECQVKKIKSVRPLLFVHRNEGDAHEGSLLVTAITANLKDYLVKKDTGAVMEGDTKFKDHETIWSFVMARGAWRVSNIEEADFSLDYVRQVKHLPNIEDTVSTASKE